MTTTLSQPKFSGTGKMPCPSWSLPAWLTCPGAAKEDGRPVEACSRCYALTGHYQRGNVQALRNHNLVDHKLPDWVDAMVPAIRDNTFFRWFDSGDVYTVDLALKIEQVCIRTPRTKHWIPTRARKDASILPHLLRIGAMPNVVVRHSSDGINGEELQGFEHTSTIVQRPEDARLGNGAGLCTAYLREGKCGSCRACWSKTCKLMAYPIHGVSVSQKTIDRLNPLRNL